MQHNFAKSYALLKKWEGGFVDHPDDKGGPTKYGITTKTWLAYLEKKGKPPVSVRKITRAQAKEIAITGYYEPVRFADLPDGLDMCVVDMAFNSGPPRAVRFLQRTLNQMGRHGLKVDGILGDRTKMIAWHTPTKPLIIAYMLNRDKFYRRQSAAEVDAFGQGWANRLDEVMKAAITVFDQRKAEARRGSPTGQAVAVVVFTLALAGLSWILRKTLGRLFR